MLSHFKASCIPNSCLIFFNTKALFVQNETFKSFSIYSTKSIFVVILWSLPKNSQRFCFLGCAVVQIMIFQFFFIIFLQILKPLASSYNCFLNSPVTRCKLFELARLQHIFISRSIQQNELFEFRLLLPIRAGKRFFILISLERLFIVFILLRNRLFVKAQTTFTIFA